MKIAASLFLIAGLVVSGLTTPVKRTVTEIEADITVISSEATAFKSAAGASPSGTLAWALVCSLSPSYLLNPLTHTPHREFTRVW